jgi:hypothetical protein
MSVFVKDIRQDTIPSSVWTFMSKSPRKNYDSKNKRIVAFRDQVGTLQKIAPLIAHAKVSLLAHGLDADDTYGLVELHSYNVKGYQKPIFDEHIDDHGGVNCIVNTAIYYLRKDAGIIGGDLRVGDQIVECTPPPGQIRVICMAGNVKHEVTPMSGRGLRKCVVVQLRCVR